MATFTESQQNKLKILLGYASVPHLLTGELQDDRPQEMLDQALLILDELTRPANDAIGDQGGIDAKLSAATSDSMASSVGNLRLNYSRHTNHLKSEGTRLLTELAMLLGVRLLYNKYAGGGSASKRSYW